MVTMEDELLTTEDISLRLKVHLNTVYRYIETGKLKAIRMAGLWRIRTSDLEAFLKTKD